MLQSFTNIDEELLCCIGQLLHWDFSSCRIFLNFMKNMFTMFYMAPEHCYAVADQFYIICVWLLWLLLTGPSQKEPTHESQSYILFPKWVPSTSQVHVVFSPCSTDKTLSSCTITIWGIIQVCSSAIREQIACQNVLFGIKNTLTLSVSNSNSYACLSNAAN